MNFTKAINFEYHEILNNSRKSKSHGPKCCLPISAKDNIMVSVVDTIIDIAGDIANGIAEIADVSSNAEIIS